MDPAQRANRLRIASVMLGKPEAEALQEIRALPDDERANLSENIDWVAAYE